MLRSIHSQRGEHGFPGYNRAYQAKEHNPEASGVMVAVLQTLSPSYPGELWKDLRDSDKVCEALNVTTRTKLNEIAAKKKGEMHFLKPTAMLRVEM